MPVTDEILDQLHDAGMLSLIDLRSGYRQLPVTLKGSEKADYCFGGEAAGSFTFTFCHAERIASFYCDRAAIFFNGADSRTDDVHLVIVKSVSYLPVVRLSSLKIVPSFHSTGNMGK